MLWQLPCLECSDSKEIFRWLFCVVCGHRWTKPAWLETFECFLGYWEMKHLCFVSMHSWMNYEKTLAADTDRDTKQLELESCCVFFLPFYIFCLSCFIIQCWMLFNVLGLSVGLWIKCKTDIYSWSRGRCPVGPLGNACMYIQYTHQRLTTQCYVHTIMSDVQWSFYYFIAGMISNLIVYCLMNWDNWTIADTKLNV